MVIASTSERARTYARCGASKVGGWLEPDAALLIAELGADQHSSGAVGEIGVHHGKLFLLLDLLRKPGETAVAIDLFEQQNLNVDFSGFGNRRVFEENLMRYSGGSDRVTIRTADSMTLSTDDLKAWGRGPYRLFSVDGGHTADITANDLRIAAGALERDGLLILDDYFNPAWPGVSEGASRYMAAAHDLEPIGSGFNKMFFSRENSAGMYRERLRSIAKCQGWEVLAREFFGVPHIVVRKRGRLEMARFNVVQAIRQVPVAYSLARTVKAQLRGH